MLSRRDGLPASSSELRRQNTASLRHFFRGEVRVMKCVGSHSRSFADVGRSESLPCNVVELMGSEYMSLVDLGAIVSASTNCS